MSDAAGPVVPPKETNYNWLWYFIFLVVASAGVAAFMIWYNLSIQLTPEKLQAAKQLWRENGPRDYDMTYTKILNRDTKVYTFKVKVRKGKVEEVLMNGKPLEREQDPDEEVKGQDPRPYHSMEQLFSNIERFMELDRRPNQPKVYVTAIFDEHTGAVRRYIRRVMGSEQRIEMHVNLEAVK